MDVLVIDDEPYIQLSLSFVLRKEGFEVDVASGGREGIAKAKEHNPRVIFLDLMMPELDGFQICRALKGDAATCGSSVIILTAKGQEVDRERGRAEGADLFMTKPFSPKEIVATVRDMMAREKV